MYGILIGGVLIAAGTARLVHRNKHCQQFILRRVLKRIGATDTQRNQIVNLVARCRDRLAGARQKLHGTHEDLATVIEADTLDTGKLEVIEARLFESIGEGTQTVRDAVAELFTILDTRQRGLLAQRLRSHGHRSHHCRACH